jgi:hypothetical protein
MSLGLTASATPEIGTAAQVQSFEGSWYGALTLGASPFSVSGTLSGKP